MLREIIKANEDIANKYGLNFKTSHYIIDGRKYIEAELYDNCDRHIKHTFDLERLIDMKMFYGTSEWIYDIFEKMAKELNKEE